MLRLLAVGIVLVCAAPSLQAAGTSHLAYFGYWGHGHNMAEFADHVNLVGIDGEHNAAAIGQAARLGLKAVVSVQGIHFESDLSGWYRAAANIRPNIEHVAAFEIADEPENWAAPWAETKRKLEKVAATVKLSFPRTPIYINFTTGFILDNSKATPAGLDWVSFDCYGRWESCWGVNQSVPQMLRRLEAKLGPGPKILLVPDAWRSPGSRATLGDLSESELVALADRYLDLAVSDSRVIGLLPFYWRSGEVPGHSITGIRDMPALKRKYAAIGRQIVSSGGRVCSPQTQPPPHWGVKNGQCLQSCGALGGTSSFDDLCENHGMSPAGNAYDALFCCKDGSNPNPTPNLGNCDERSRFREKRVCENVFREWECAPGSGGCYVKSYIRPPPADHNIRPTDCDERDNFSEKRVCENVFREWECAPGPRDCYVKSYIRSAPDRLASQPASQPESEPESQPED